MDVEYDSDSSSKLEPGEIANDANSIDDGGIFAEYSAISDDKLVEEEEMEEYELEQQEEDEDAEEPQEDEDVEEQEGEQVGEGEEVEVEEEERIESDLSQLLNSQDYQVETPDIEIDSAELDSESNDLVRNMEREFQEFDTRSIAQLVLQQQTQHSENQQISNSIHSIISNNDNNDYTESEGVSLTATPSPASISPPPRRRSSITSQTLPFANHINEIESTALPPLPLLNLLPSTAVTQSVTPEILTPITNEVVSLFEDEEVYQMDDDQEEEEEEQIILVQEVEPVEESGEEVEVVDETTSIEIASDIMIVEDSKLDLPEVAAEIIEEDVLVVEEIVAEEPIEAEEVIVIEDDEDDEDDVVLIITESEVASSVVSPPVPEEVTLTESVSEESTLAEAELALHQEISPEFAVPVESEEAKSSPKVSLYSRVFKFAWLTFFFPFKFKQEYIEIEQFNSPPRVHDVISAGEWDPSTPIRFGTVSKPVEVEDIVESAKEVDVEEVDARVEDAKVEDAEVQAVGIEAIEVEDVEVEDAQIEIVEDALVDSEVLEDVNVQTADSVQEVEDEISMENGNLENNLPSDFIEVTSEEVFEPEVSKLYADTLPKNNTDIFFFLLVNRIYCFRIRSSSTNCNTRKWGKLASFFGLNLY